VKPAPFEYLAPRALDEALAALARHGADAKVLAGGQSLVPMMNMRLARPAVVIDVNRVAGLDDVCVDDGAVRLGAMVRQRRLERDRGLARGAPLLAEAAPLIGHLQTRSRGTVGGSLAHADPAAELPACAIAMDATIHVTSARGARTVAAADFFQGLFTTALAPDELLVAVEAPRVRAPAPGSAFLEVARRLGDFALAGVAAVVGLDRAGTVRHVRCVVFGASDVPHRAQAAEALLGRVPTEATCADAGRAAAAELTPHADVHATAEYRRRVAASLAGRALWMAASRAAASRDGDGALRGGGTSGSAS
jgi:carbon-monoxide dehydrogenase medium subunit